MKSKALKTIIALALVTLMSLALSGCALATSDFDEYSIGRKLYNSTLYGVSDGAVGPEAEYYLNKYSQANTMSAEELKKDFERDKKVLKTAKAFGVAPKKANVEGFYEIFTQVDYYVGAYDAVMSRPEIVSEVEEGAAARGMSAEEYASEAVIGYIPYYLAWNYLLNYYYQNIYEGDFVIYSEADFDAMTDEERRYMTDYTNSEEFEEQWVGFLKEFDEYCENLE